MAGSCLDWEVGYSAPPKGGDTALGVAVDGSGNVIAVGYAKRTDLGQGKDWVVRKYDPAGSLLWSRSYPTSGDDQANGVAVSSDGRIFVAGSVNGVGWMVRAYGPGGADLWSDTGPGIANANGAAVGSDGNLVVAGGNPSWMVRKYGLGGSILWTRTLVAAGSTNDEAHGVAVDSAGIVAAAGESAGHWLVALYDAAGNDVSSFAYTSDASHTDVANAVAFASDGNLLLAGYEGKALFGSRTYATVRKYDRGGALVWSHAMPGSNPYGAGGTAQGIVEGRGGLVYAGAVLDALWTVSGLSPNGKEVWTDQLGTTVNSSGNDGGNVHAVAAGPSGAVVAAGWKMAPVTGWYVRSYLDPSTCPGAALRGSESVVVYPNPVKGDSVRVAVKLTADAEEITLDAYSVAMRRVFTGTWKNVRQTEGGVMVTGLSRWAPGLYYIKVRVKGSGGGGDYALTRLAVKR